MKRYITVHAPHSGKPIRGFVTQDDQKAELLFLRVGPLACTLTPKHAIELATSIADLLEAQRGNTAA